MTTALPPDTLAGQQIDLLRRMNELIAQHPVGGVFRLLFAPDDLPVADDVIFVQTARPDRGVLELVPRKVADLAPGDVLHATQALDPADADLTASAAGAAAMDCWPWQQRDKTGHMYTT